MSTVSGIISATVLGSDVNGQLLSTSASNSGANNAVVLYDSSGNITVPSKNVSCSTLAASTITNSGSITLSGASSNITFSANTGLQSAGVLATTSGGALTQKVVSSSGASSSIVQTNLSGLITAGGGGFTSSGPFTGTSLSKFTTGTGGLALAGHLVSSGTTPTIASNAAGIGSGIGVAVSVFGTDIAGAVTITTGSVIGSANSAVCTVTFSNSYVNSPYVILQPSVTQAAANVQVYVSSTTTTFTINSNATALPAATSFVWAYHTLV